MNDLFTAFAQFVDHDLSSSANGLDDDLQQVVCQCEEQIENPFCLNIPTPDMPDQTCMLFPRSSALFQKEPACQLSKLFYRKTCVIQREVLGVREQVNQINSFVDASMVYGNTKSKSDELRSFIQG